MPAPSPARLISAIRHRLGWTPDLPRPVQAVDRAREPAFAAPVLALPSNDLPWVRLGRKLTEEQSWQDVQSEVAAGRHHGVAEYGQRWGVHKSEASRRISAFDARYGIKFEQCDRYKRIVALGKRTLPPTQQAREFLTWADTTDLCGPLAMPVIRAAYREWAAQANVDPMIDLRLRRALVEAGCRPCAREAGRRLWQADDWLDVVTIAEPTPKRDPKPATLATLETGELSATVRVLKAA